MNKKVICLYAVILTLGVAAAWLTTFQPAARACASRGGHYYAWEGNCGTFVYVSK